MSNIENYLIYGIIVQKKYTTLTIKTIINRQKLLDEAHALGLLRNRANNKCFTFYVKLNKDVSSKFLSRGTYSSVIKNLVI